MSLAVRRASEIAKAILCPSSTSAFVVIARNDRYYWVAYNALLVIPFTAILHHVVFFPPTCIFNAFGIAYSFSALAVFFHNDPSLAYAIILCIIHYQLGKSRSWLRLLSAPGFVSLLPLSIWLWDIPFSNSFICTHFHDGGLVISDCVIRTRYFYVLAGIIYMLISGMMVLRSRGRALEGNDACAENDKNHARHS
jgi:hypothetical protein